MDNKEHLPVYGVGPYYGVSIIIITIAGITMSCLHLLNFAKFEITRYPFFIVGVLIILLGIGVWYSGAFRIDKHIKSNQLCTSGSYRIVRNPCYSGVMLACTGALFIANNLILLVLPFLYWLAMTILLKNTEEKWLTKLYGEEYINYCKKVNRCIPWFARKES